MKHILLEIMKNTKDWEQTGLLIDLPQEKHQKIINSFNVAMEHVYKRKEKYSESYLCVFLPVIRRIFSDYELNKEETI